MAFSLTITAFTDTTDIIFQVVIQSTPPESPDSTTTLVRVLLATYTLLLFSPVSVCLFLVTCFAKSHNNGYISNHLIYLFLSDNSTTEKSELPRLPNYTHASHLLPHTTLRRDYCLAPLHSSARLSCLPSPDALISTQNNCTRMPVFSTTHVFPYTFDPVLSCSRDVWYTLCLSQPLASRSREKAALRAVALQGVAALCYNITKIQCLKICVSKGFRAT